MAIKFQVECAKHHEKTTFYSTKYPIKWNRIRDEQ